MSIIDWILMYVFCIFLVAIVGIGIEGTTRGSLREEEIHKWGCRAIILSPAWPVFILVLLCCGGAAVVRRIPGLWDAAEFTPRKDRKS